MSSIVALWAGLLLGVGGPVTGLSIAPDAERTQVLISVEGVVQYRDFTMEGPSRLIVDIFGAQHELPADNYLDINRGGVISVRTSQYSSEVVRVVLELGRTVAYEVVPAEGGLRIVLSAGAGAFDPWATSDFAQPQPSVTRRLGVRRRLILGFRVVFGVVVWS